MSLHEHEQHLADTKPLHFPGDHFNGLNGYHRPLSPPILPNLTSPSVAPLNELISAVPIQGSLTLYAPCLTLHAYHTVTQRC